MRKKKLMLEAEGVKFNMRTVANKAFVISYQELRRLGNRDRFDVIS